VTEKLSASLNAAKKKVEIVFVASVAAVRAVYDGRRIEGKKVGAVVDRPYR